MGVRITILCGFQKPQSQLTVKLGTNVKEIYRAGADLIVLGNGCEHNPDLLAEACAVRDEIRLSE